MSQVPSNLGISYTIDIKGNLAEGLTRLSTAVETLKASLAGITTTLETTKGNATQTTAKLAAATDKLAASSAKVSSQMSIQEKAIKAQDAALEKFLVKRAQANVEAQRDFEISGKKATRDQQSIAANKALNKVLEQRYTLERLATQIRERGIKLSDEELIRLKLASKVPGVANTAKAQVGAGLASAVNLDPVGAIKARAAAKRDEAKATALLNDEEFKNATISARVAKIKLDEELTRRANATLGRTPQPISAASVTGGKAPSSPANSFLKNALGISDDDTNKVNRTIESLKRLVGVVLVLKAIRFISTGFNDVVKGSIAFNSELERANLGIATIITGAGVIRDITGQQVTGARAFALAQKEAAKQTAQLRIDALKTVAPLNNIIEAFQTAIGPGLGAGLNLDQIRKFSVQISRAATSIGLEQGQLAEEIRSILQGTISTRQTRIATVLGISNDDIKRAKEAGTLADLLNQKFSAFNLAGEKIGQTFEGSLNRVKSSLLSLGSSASLGVFEQLKGLFQDVSNLLLSINNEAGQIEINPQFKGAAEEFFSSIERIVVSIRTLVKAADFSAVASSARTLGQILEGAFAVVSGIVKGVISFANDLRGISDFIGALFKSIPVIGDLFNTASLREVVSVLTQIYISFAVIRGVAVTMPAIIKAIDFITTVWGFTMGIVQNRVLGTRIAILGLRAAFGTLDLVVKRSIVGLAIAVASLLALTVLQKTGILQTLTDKLLGTNRDLGAKEDAMRSLRDEAFAFFNDLPGQIVGTTQALKDQDSTIADLRKSYERLATERDIAFKAVASQGGVPSSSLSGAVAEATKIATEAVLDAQTKTREIEKERLQNSQALRGAAQQELSARLNLLETARATKVSEESILKIQDKVLKGRQQIAEATLRVQAASLKDLNQQDNTTVRQSRGDSDAFLANVVKEASIRSVLVSLSEEEAKASKANADAHRADLLNSKELVAAKKDLVLREADLKALHIPENVAGTPPQAIPIQEDIKRLQAEIEDRQRNQPKLAEAATAAWKKLVSVQATSEDILRSAQVDESKIGTIQDGLLEIANKRLAAQERLAEISQLQAGNESEITAATRRKLIEDAAAIREQVANDLTQSLSSIKVGTDAENEAARKKVRDTINSTLEVQARIVGLKEKEIALDIAKLAVEREVNQAANAKLAIAFQQANFDLKNKNLADQVGLQNQIATFAVRNADAEQRAFVESQNTTRDLALRVKLARELRDAGLAANANLVGKKSAEVASLNQDITGSPFTSPSLTAQRSNTFKELPTADQADLINKANTAQLALNGALEQQRQLQTENVTLRTQETEAIRQQAIIEEENRIRAGGPGVTFGQQLNQAAEDLAKTLPSKFQQIFNTLQNIVTGFSSFASDAIVDAFDPTKKVDLKARFAAFLQDVARQIINQLVTIAVTKAALGLTGILSSGFAGGGEVKAPQGFFRGGRAGRAPTRHVVRGYDSGGVATGPSLPHLRPPGIDRRDTIPAWLSVGEFIQPVHRVAQYGADFMEALRQGMIDPAQARSMMPGSRARRNSSTVSSHAVRSFAAGGGVGAVRAATNSTSQATPQTQIVPALVANDATIDQLFRGGGTAANRWLAEQGYVRQ